MCPGGLGLIKSEMVARLSARYPHFHSRDVERIVNAVLDSISEALAKGRRVELRDFGAFSVKSRPSRMGMNPRTGEPVAVSEKRALHFRTGRELRKRLNGSTPEP
jgi:integration host factor subunit beta